MSLLQIRGSDAQETYNSLINSIPTKCLFGPKHWHVDEERTKKMIVIIAAVHTERNGRTRIISARKAEPKLQEVYNAYIKQINR